MLYLNTNALRFARSKIETARFRLYDATRFKKTCVIGGQSIKVEAASPIELHRVHRYQTREPDTVKWMADYIKPGQVFYDIGANIGLFSIFVAKKLKGHVKVYSFEPESQNYGSLNRNVYLNGLSDCVSTFCLAVSDSISIDTFFVREQLNAGAAIHQFASPIDQSGVPFAPVHQQGMIGISLDHLCFEYGLDFPNHIKIDVDGYEPAVIQGASKVIKDPRLESVLVEITEEPSNREITDEILLEFRDAGFFQLKRAPASLSAPNPTSFNYIFVRRGGPSK